MKRKRFFRILLAGSAAVMATPMILVSASKKIINNPLKEYAAGYFRALLKQAPINIKFGDTLKMGMIFYDKDGNPSEIHGLTTVHKDEL